ncbi:MAG: VTT domain-containing protein [Actinomycetota bacterium]|nr:VTT domain-containing protein [Actinomycetota bacterium]
MTRRAAVLRLVALLLLIAAALALAQVIGVPSVDQLRARFEPWGWWGAAAYATLYAVATLSPLPKSVFSLAAGALFGLGWGVGVVVVGACAGAMLAFYLARALGREGLHRLTGVRGDRLDDQLARRAFLTVLVLRLVPVVPFTAVNYLAGVTSLRAPTFLSATAVGILPLTTAYVALGAYGSQPGSWPFWTALASVVVLTAGGAVVAVRQRRREASRTGETGG